MATPRKFGNFTVKLEGAVLLARPNSELIDDWVAKELCEPIVFASVVGCSGSGSELTELGNFLGSLYSDPAEFNAYKQLCCKARQSIDEHFIEQCCYLMGRDPKIFRVFLNPGGNIGRWLSKMALETIEIGHFRFDGNLELKLQSPYSTMCMEAKNASPKAYTA